MDDVQTLYLCMGSACHQLKGYGLLPVLEELILKHGLKDRLILKGAFCLDTCREGRSLKFRNRIYTGLDAEQLPQLFEKEILPYVKTS